MIDGIEVKPVNNLFTAYYMKETKLIGGNNKPIKSNDRTFPVLEKVNIKIGFFFMRKVIIMMLKLYIILYPKPQKHLI